MCKKIEPCVLVILIVLSLSNALIAIWYRCLSSKKVYRIENHMMDHIIFQCLLFLATPNSRVSIKYSFIVPQWYYIIDCHGNVETIHQSKIQWNLSIADMLYSGHVSIADTFFRNQCSQATVKVLYLDLSIADTSL